MIDLNTTFGHRVAKRLSDDLIIWLITTGIDGTPQPRPIWFLWDQETVLMYSAPNTYKLRHIQQQPRVALNFDGDGRGGNIVVFTAEAWIDPKAPRADAMPAFIEKYQAGFERIGMTAKTFADRYSIAIRATLNSLRGH